MANILIYGDSNTFGTPPMEDLTVQRRFAPRHRWPEVLASELGPEHRVIAEGLPGRTTVHDDPVEGGRRNGLAVLPAVLQSHWPLDLVIFLLGTNDLKHRFGVTAFEIARSAGRLVREAQALLPEARILLMAPAPVRETGILADVFAGAEARQAGLAGHMERVAAEAGAAFLDAGAHVAVSDRDGVHWEPDSQVAFGRAVAPTVRRILDLTLPAVPGPDGPTAPVTLAMRIPEDWVDYNGHMNEAHYLKVFSDATDRMLLWAGMDAACVAEGQSVFTVETHIRHLGEIDIGDRIAVTTRVLEGGGKKLHLWHEIYVGERLCATGEQMLLHVDLAARRSVAPRADIADWFARTAAAHASQALPEGLGRHVGQPRG